MSGPWPNQWGYFMSNVWLTFSSGNFKSSCPLAFCDEKIWMYRKVERIVQGTPTWNHHRDSAVVNNKLVYLSSSPLSQFTSYLQVPLHFPKDYACVSSTRDQYLFLNFSLFHFYFHWHTVKWTSLKCKIPVGLTNTNTCVTQTPLTVYKSPSTPEHSPRPFPVNPHQPLFPETTAI